MHAPTKSCASLPTTRSIDVSSLGERPHRVKRGKPKMGLVSTPRQTPRPDIRKPLRISNHPFVRAKNISPLHSRLVLRCQIAAPAAVNHQYVRKPLCIPNHPIVGAKYFSPGRRPLVARNRLTISAAQHMWHGRNIFCPYICHCYPVARLPSWPLSIINMFANLFAYPIINCRGEKYFARTSAIGGA